MKTGSARYDGKTRRATVTKPKEVLQETRQSIMEDEYNGEISAGAIEEDLSGP